MRIEFLDDGPQGPFPDAVPSWQMWTEKGRVRVKIVSQFGGVYLWGLEAEAFVKQAEERKTEDLLEFLNRFVQEYSQPTFEPG